MVGWRWVRDAEGPWHRTMAGTTACGLPEERVGVVTRPPASEPVCIECARLTGFRRRPRVRKVVVRAELPADQVAEVKAAGLDPEELLRDGWRTEMDRRRPLPKPGPGRDVELEVLKAATALLPRYGGKGVPVRELVRTAGLPRRDVHAALRGTPNTMRLGDRVCRAYPAKRLLALREPGGVG